MPFVIDDIAAGAGIAAGAATVASGIASIFADAPSGNRPLELPPELEANQLSLYSQFLSQAQADIESGLAQIPYLEQRIKAMDELARQTTPSAESIQRLNKIDQDIAERFGKETLADVQSGIITDRAKKQIQSVQAQITAELEAQGKFVDDQLASEIQQSIRNRIAGGSKENALFDEVGRQLLDEIKRTGDPLAFRDPIVESQIKEQEQSLRSRLRQQFGADYENTTQGRRALKDFFQGSTELRFKTAQEGANQRVQRLASLGQTTSGIVGARDTGLLQSAETAKSAADIARGKLTRLSDINTLTQGTLANTLAAGEPERQRQLLDIQRANAAQASIQGTRNQLAQGLQSQAEILKLSTLPQQLRDQLLRTRASTLEAGERLGQFKLSNITTDALRGGSIGGFQGRSVIYGGQEAQKIQETARAKEMQAEIERKRQIARGRGGY